MDAAVSSTNVGGVADTSLYLKKQVESHEVAIAELKNLLPSRAVYQRNGNIFFRTTMEKATASEQRRQPTDLK
ncbi:Prefoldin [Quillaja saponaria]|uniref:Prefoldin n=1 Tax=Quillaja saponaria TaxID=32244 RepID=A0AAD7LNY3_QUISA|nr:Prefoldin [Quillaja saponaria]